MGPKKDIASRYSAKTIKYEYYGAVELSHPGAELKGIVAGKKMTGGMEKGYIYAPYTIAMDTIQVTGSPIPKPNKYKKLKDYLKQNNG